MITMHAVKTERNPLLDDGAIASAESIYGRKTKPAACALSRTKSFVVGLRQPHGCLRALGVSGRLIHPDKNRRKLRQEGLAKRRFWDREDLIGLFDLAMSNYTRLAKRHHADKGGDHGPMVQINVARDRLRKMYRKRGLIE